MDESHIGGVPITLNGQLKGIRTPGGHTRIEVSEFQRFLFRYGMPAFSWVLLSRIRPPSAIVWPSFTAMELATLRSEIVGELICEEVVVETSLTSCEMSISTKPLSFTRGVTFRITPVSR